MSGFFPYLAESGNIFQYFRLSNTAGQIVVFLLLVFSLLAWTLMVGKFFDLSQLQKLNRYFQHKQEGVTTVLSSTEILRGIRGPYATLFHKAVEAYQQAASVTYNPSKRIEFIENALQRSVAEITMQHESKMVYLASIVTCAPFLGLLGTVWGVMDAFGSITLQSSANIQTLAPGVSGALLTTVAGLFVAIPSVIGYNLLLSKAKNMIVELENFASALIDRIELEIQQEENLST